MMSPMAWVYLGFAIVAQLSTLVYNAIAYHEVGLGGVITGFIRVGFSGPAILKSLACDFWIGAWATTIWMVVEARRLRMRHWYAYFLFALISAWAAGIAFFFFLRERHLARVTPAAADGGGAAALSV